MITIVAAVGRGGAIGKGGALPWSFPEDMAHFKALTLGHAVVMGRKTWQSIPARFRPLPDRTNIVLTRDHIGFAPSGAYPVPDLRTAVIFARQCSEKVDIIGGAQVYAQQTQPARVLGEFDEPAHDCGITVAVKPAPAKCATSDEADRASDVALLEESIAYVLFAFTLGMTEPRCCRCGGKTIGGTMDDGAGLVVDIVIACVNPACDAMTDRVTYEEPIDEATAVFIARCKPQFGELV